MWLRMDRPENLMVIESLMWLDGPVEPRRLRELMRERVVDTYPVFSQRPRTGPFGRMRWEDDPDLDLGRHVRHERLPAASGTDPEQALRHYVERHMARPLDRDHPLWEVHLLDGAGEGSVVYTRMHHALADGVALAQILLSMTDATPSGRPASGAESAPEHRVAVGLPDIGRLVATAPQLVTPSGAAAVARTGAQTVEVLRKLLLGSNAPTPFGGPPGTRKTAVWSAPRPLEDLRQVARTTGAHLNDVLVSAVAGAVHDWLVWRGVEPVDLTTMVPVNLRPADRPLPPTLGNEFALVLLPLPSSIGVPLARLAETRRRMDAIKDSPEAVITWGISAGIGSVLPDLERPLVNFFAGKAIGVTTDVIGPAHSRYLAGTRVTGVLGWVPGSGSHTLGVALFSYAGDVRVGFKADTASVPGAQRLVEAFDAELDALVRMARAA